MQFFSTRDQNRKVTSSQAIAQGLSDEGGLFVPESFPQVDVKALCGLDYPALAAAVVLAVTSLPVTAFAEKKDSTEIRCLQKSL